MSLSWILVGAAVLFLLAVLLWRGRETTPPGFSLDVDAATEQDIPVLLTNGRKIDAIKVYRRLHGVDLYWAVWFLAANLFVIGYEEPTLRRRFGASYEEYTRRVRRWIPRFRSDPI